MEQWRNGEAENREKQKSREKIITLLSQDNTLSATLLAERIGITPKAVEKQIAKLKADGVLKRIGPDKGGHWLVYSNMPAATSPAFSLPHKCSTMAKPKAKL